MLEQLQFINAAGSVGMAMTISLPGMSPGDVVDLLDLGQVVDRSPAHLSKGMRQRVSLAMGLARPFRMLLADEPLGGLDRESEERVLSALQGLVGEGRTVVVATHEDNLIAASSRVIELHEGAIHSRGPTGSV